MNTAIIPVTPTVFSPEPRGLNLLRLMCAALIVPYSAMIAFIVTVFASLACIQALLNGVTSIHFLGQTVLHEGLGSFTGVAAFLCIAVLFFLLMLMGIRFWLISLEALWEGIWVLDLWFGKGGAIIRMIQILIYSAILWLTLSSALRTWEVTNRLIGLDFLNDTLLLSSPEWLLASFSHIAWYELLSIATFILPFVFTTAVIWSALRLWTDWRKKKLLK